MLSGMEGTSQVANLVERILAGERLALARLLTQVENDTPEGQASLDALFPYTGKAHLIGVTGSPGTGKSSLVNRLARYYRHPTDGSAPRRVAIVAVDPTSPFTGGAVLGDRVRMQDLSGDSGVFIRSMASRGALGGLSHATAAVAQVFDAAGFDVVIIETVGAGQSEVDIAKLAHTTLVVEAPGLGDDIQAIKAGILEIADILVINKADRPGAENTERTLRAMLELAHPSRYRDQPAEIFWMPLVQRTVAIEGQGLPELVQAIARHYDYLRHSGEWQTREQARIQAELDYRLQSALVQRWQVEASAEDYRRVLEDLVSRRISPYDAVRTLLRD